jgi:hypothetical protein
MVCVASGISNAVFHATGRRIRDLPIRIEKSVLSCAQIFLKFGLPRSRFSRENPDRRDRAGIAILWIALFASAVVSQTDPANVSAARAASLSGQVIGARRPGSHEGGKRMPRFTIYPTDQAFSSPT